MDHEIMSETIHVVFQQIISELHFSAYVLKDMWIKD